MELLCTCIWFPEGTGLWGLGLGECTMVWCRGVGLTVGLMMVCGDERDAIF